MSFVLPETTIDGRTDDSGQEMKKERFLLLNLLSSFCRRFPARHIRRLERRLLYFVRSTIINEAAAESTVLPKKYVNLAKQDPGRARQNS